MTKEEIFIGIDVCKPRLDITVLPTGERLEFENNSSGIKKFLKYIKKLKPTLMTCEYTGGLEQDLLLACSENQLPLAVVNPRQVKDFAKALGQLAKTDAIDASILAQFAARIKPSITIPSSQHVQALEAIVVRRKQLLEILIMERNRLGSTRDVKARTSIEKVISFLEEQLTDIDGEMLELVRQNSELKNLDELLQSVPADRPGSGPARKVLKLGQDRCRSVQDGVLPLKFAKKLNLSLRHKKGPRSSFKNTRPIPELDFCTILAPKLALRWLRWHHICFVQAGHWQFLSNATKPLEK